MRHSSFAAIWLILLSSVFAAPTLELEDRAVNVCSAVDVIVKVLKVYNAAATSFCSSFISIPVQTSVVFDTSTVIPPPGTTSVPNPVTVTTLVTATTTVTPPAYTYIYNAPHGVPRREERDLIEERDLVEERAAKKIPPYLVAFASAQISAACSCLSIKPSATTVRSISVVTAPASTITALVTTTVATFTSTVSTVTSTAAVPTISTCSSAYFNNFNNLNNYNNFNLQQVTLNNYNLDKIGCCNACYSTTNCVAFEFFAGIGPGNICQLDLTPTSSGLPTVNPNPDPLTCPAGQIQGTGQPYSGSGSNIGVLEYGPCIVVG